MGFDVVAAERLAAEASEAMKEAARKFSAGLRELVEEAQAEAARERQQLNEGSTVLARERQRLEEAWQNLNVERSRLEASGHLLAGHKPVLYPSIESTLEEANLSSSRLSTIGQGGHVPANYIVSVADRAYTVLPLKEPSCSSLGHDLWNHVVEVPEGWEVLSTQMEGFPAAMNVLGQHRWGAMVLGVQNAKRGFDAFWTPLFGDGSFAAQLCEEDVDWIEKVGAEDPPRRFRMTYSGLRLVIRMKAGASFVSPAGSYAMTFPKQAAAGPIAPQMQAVPGFSRAPVGIPTHVAMPQTVAYPPQMFAMPPGAVMPCNTTVLQGPTSSLQPSA